MRPGVGHYGLHEELTAQKIQVLVRTNWRVSPASDEPAASGAEAKIMDISSISRP